MPAPAPAPGARKRPGQEMEVETYSAAAMILDFAQIARDSSVIVPTASTAPRNATARAIVTAQMPSSSLPRITPLLSTARGRVRPLGAKGSGRPGSPVVSPPERYDDAASKHGAISFAQAFQMLTDETYQGCGEVRGRLACHRMKSALRHAHASGNLNTAPPCSACTAPAPVEGDVAGGGAALRV